MAEKYYSFAEVLRALQIEEADLRQLVSEGEINAINDGVSVKFAKSEVDNIRNSRMDAGTMLVTNSNYQDDEVMMVEDLSESEAISAIEEVGSSLTLEAEFADSSDSSAFVNLDESSPLLSVNDSDEEDQPILNISSEIKKSKMRNDVKEDTEELIFEQSSGEDLLETGELLFDSVNQVLPRDRKEAELFTESEMGISDDYDDIDEASVKAAIDFVDSSDEEPISTSTPKSGVNFSASEVQKRQRMKSVAGISVGLLTFGVIALFFFFPPNPNKTTPIVTLHVVEEIPSQKGYKYESELEVVRSSIINSKSSGLVTQILAKNTLVKKGQNVAVVTGENKTVKSQYEKLNKKFQRGVQLYNKMKPDEGKYRALYSKYQKERKQGKKPTLDNNVKKYLTLKRDLPKLKKNLDELKTKMGGATTITSPVNGIIEQVHAKNNDTVNQGTKIYTIGEIHELNCSFRISKGDGNNWKSGDSVTVTVNGVEMPAVVDNIIENESTQPVTLGVHLRVANTNNKLLPGTKVSLEYQKEFHALAIPKNTIYEKDGKSYVFVILEDKNKVLKREIQTAETYDNGCVRVINNLYVNDKIVSDNKQILEDNQDVTIKTP